MGKALGSNRSQLKTPSKGQPQLNTAAAMPFKNLIITTAILITVIFGLFKLDAFPKVLYDEPMYANTAHTYSTTGKLDNHLTVHSGKEFFLYPLLLSTYTKIAPDSLLGYRKFSVLMSVLSVFLFGQIVFSLIRSQWIAGLTIAAFVTSNVFFVGSRVIRPEALGVTVFLGLVFVTLKYLYEQKAKWAAAFGCLAGCLFLVHPAAGILGFAFIAALVAYSRLEVSRKSIWPVIVGVFPIGVLMVLFFTFMTDLTPGTWLHQIVSSSKAPSSQSFVSGFWANVVWFFDGYMLGMKRLILVLVEAIAVVWAIRQSKHQLANVFGATVVVFLAIAFSAFQPILRPYFLYIVPLVILLMGIMFDMLDTKVIHVAGRRANIKTIGIFCLSLYAAYSLMGNLYALNSQRHNEPLADIKNKIEQIISYQDGDQIIMSHHYFWFWFKDKAVYASKEPLKAANIDITKPAIFINNSFPNSASDSEKMSHTTGTKTIFSHANQPPTQFSQAIQQSALALKALMEENNLSPEEIMSTIKRETHNINTNAYGPINLIQVERKQKRNLSQGKTRTEQPPH